MDTRRAGHGIGAGAMAAAKTMVIAEAMVRARASLTPANEVELEDAIWKSDCRLLLC